MRLSCTVFEIFRASYLSKVADFDSPDLHLAPAKGVIPVEFRGDLWHQKTRVLGLSCGVVFVILRFSRTPTCNGRTDTGPWLVPRMHCIVKTLFVACTIHDV